MKRLKDTKNYYLNQFRSNMPDVQTIPDISQLKQKIALLYLYMNKHLGFREAPRVILTKSEENANKQELGLTGYYNPQDKVVKLFITNRSISDCLRSASHELVHHWQNEHGMLNAMENSNGHYAQEDPNLRKREYEAFLYGSILFRDFQDEKRYGPSKVNNPLPKIV